ncbi:MAG: hypothetical protein V3V47_01830 [Desulfobacteria bacterium]
MKRYKSEFGYAPGGLTNNMVEDSDGEYVKLEDVDKLRKSLAALVDMYERGYVSGVAPRLGVAFLDETINARNLLAL